MLVRPEPMRAGCVVAPAETPGRSPLRALFRRIGRYLETRRQLRRLSRLDARLRRDIGLPEAPQERPGVREFGPVLR